MPQLLLIQTKSFICSSTTMEDFDSHFFVSVDEHTYQVIPSDGDSFLILMEGVKVGGLSKDENSQWQWTDSNLAQDFAEQIGQKIESHN